jgi:hypothetical protein
MLPGPRQLIVQVTKTTIPQDEHWTVEPLRVSERELLIEALLRRIAELELKLAAGIMPEQSLR